MAFLPGKLEIMKFCDWRHPDASRTFPEASSGRTFPDAGKRFPDTGRRCQPPAEDENSW